MWLWCNLAASQRRPYCASMNSHSPVGLVIRQWDAIDWACVLCDRHVHKSPSFNGDCSFAKSQKSQGAKCELQGGWQTWVMWCFSSKSLHESCRMGRHIVVIKLICSLGHCECDGHTVHKLSQQRLSANWLVPQGSDCSQMCSKVSSDWLPSYIKATLPVRKILKMAGYFLDSPRSILSPFYETW